MGFQSITRTELIYVLLVRAEGLGDNKAYRQPLDTRPQPPPHHYPITKEEE